MDGWTAGEVIKDRIDTEQVMELYGYRTKHGFMNCPFHGDHNASLKVYKGRKGWHCFGCGKGGSVIDFVMEHEGCRYYEAVKAIDSHFKLGLTEPGDPLAETDRRAFRRNLDRLAGNLIEQTEIITEMINLDLDGMADRMSAIASKDKSVLTADEYIEMLRLKSEMEYLEYKIDRCREIREEVRQWRSQKLMDQAKARSA